MTATAEFVDLYDILRIAETADEKQITEAIRSERRTWQKRAAQSDPQRRADAEKRMQQLDEAERVLKDQAKRRQFNAERAAYRPPTQRVSPEDQTGTRNWLMIAKQYMANGNPHGANYAAREAITQTAANHEAWYIRATSSFFMGNAADAEYEFHEAIRIQPDEPDYHFDLAEAYSAQGKLREALSEYETALRLVPSNPVYKTAIADVFLRQGKAEEALNLMEDVVKAEPDQEVFQYYLAWALHDVNIKRWTSVAGGRVVITSPEQIALTRKMSGRALKLKFKDADLRHELEKNMKIANDAEEMIWIHSSNLGGYAFGLFVSFVGIFAAYGLGLVPLGLIIWMYVARHRKPRWQFQAKAAGVPVSSSTGSRY